MVNEIVDFFMAPLRRVNIEQLVADTVDEYDEEIVKLNLSQLAAGKLATGESITPFYRPVTIKIKQAKNQRTDAVTLRDKGNFYNGTYARRSGAGTEISSSDEKTDALQTRYLVDIFGLSVASKEQLAERMRPSLQDKFNQAIL